MVAMQQNPVSFVRRRTRTKEYLRSPRVILLWHSIVGNAWHLGDDHSRYADPLLHPVFRSWRFIETAPSFCHPASVRRSRFRC